MFGKNVPDDDKFANDNLLTNMHERKIHDATNDADNTYETKEDTRTVLNDSESEEPTALGVEPLGEPQSDSGTNASYKKRRRRRRRPRLSLLSK